jgi:hypothetical protein
MRAEEDGDEEDGEDAKPSIDRLLEEAEANDIVQLDALRYGSLSCVRDCMNVLL